MKIMLCYEGSETNKGAVAAAGDLARALAGELLAVTSKVGGAEISAEAIKRAERDLEQLKNHYTAVGLTVETHLLIRGLSPGEDLVRFAEENGIDQIVIGIRKKSKVGKLIFGSTAQKVILEAPCPVLTVK